MPTYDHVTKPVFIRPGLSDFLIGVLSEFTTISAPVAPFTNPGDSVTIASAHVPATGKGFYRCYQVKTKHEGKSTSSGTFGAKTMKNEFKVFVPGTDAATLEFVMNIINEEVMTLHRDADCEDPNWFQLGDGCTNAEIDSEFTTGTTDSGDKGYVLTVKWNGIPKVYAATVPYAP